jgi:hypothetical protein
MAARRLIPNEWFVKAYQPVISVGESVPGVHGALTCMLLWCDYLHSVHPSIEVHLMN